MKNRRLLYLLFFVTFAQFTSFSQKDTQFWFVASEIAQGSSFVNYDQPVVFRFSTYSSPATVTVTQPANPSFPSQITSIPANSSGVVQFPPMFNEVENKPPNQILNKGFLINSTTPITAYYEIIGTPGDNPELFSLKGKNALGTAFFVPFQNILVNSNDYSPSPHASFDIVATENNTSITITPTQPIVGHQANVPFTITLNQGQTYSSEAVGQWGTAHPSGSSIVSNKPIAVTVKDDLLDGSTLFGGFCDDVIGDQIVPVEKIGTKYVIQKGFLNGDERAFVVGTASSTKVKMDGILQGNLDAGQTMELMITGGGHFIETSSPVYLLQMTGIGCEVAGEVLPAFDCTGSSAVRFVRSSNEDFYIFLVTRNGAQGGFILNGNNSIIPAGAFQTVPGSNGEFVAAVIPFSTSEVLTGKSSIVENSIDVFQMGFLNGAQGTGCRFGYFSDYGYQVDIPQAITFCPGSTVTIDGVSYAQPGTVTDTILATTGCDTIITYTLTLLPSPTRAETISFCPGSSVLIDGVSYTQPGTVVDTLPATTGCDTIVTYTLTFLPLLTRTETIPLCLGESVTIYGAPYTQPGTVTDTILGASGCDTLVTYILEKSDLSVHLTDTLEILQGQSIALAPATSSTHGIQVVWSPPTGLSAPTTLNPAATPQVTMEYFLLATDDFGCTATDSIVVRVISCPINLYIPNIFSPNDDGVNDVFTVFANPECILKISLLRVYDRWGELVFEQLDFAPNEDSYGWDGAFRKKKAAPGVYVYYAEAVTYLGATERKSGAVTLLR